WGAGRASGGCTLRLGKNQGAELLGGADIPPGDAARHAGVRAMLTQTGHQAAAASIDARWRELVSLSGQAPPAEYDLTYPVALMDLIATAVFTFARDVGLVPWSGGSSAPDLHIGTLLNGAWDGFFSDPAAFAAFEKQQIAAIRSRLSPSAP